MRAASRNLLSALLWTAAWACHRHAPTVDVSSRAPQSTATTSVAVVTSAQATVESEPVTGAARNCQGCHAREVLQWQGSMHHASFTSVDFQHSYHAEPQKFCVDCHAPLTTESGARDTEAGIGCQACHQVPREHLAVRTNTRAHVATTSCNGCHDFDVPGTQTILQSTVLEHAASPERDVACITCHMRPRADGMRNHAFSVSRNSGLLGKALRVHHASIGASEIVVALQAVGVGHRFPTGDIFRRLTITLTASNAAGNLVCADTFHLSRDWQEHRASLKEHRRERLVTDTRLTDAAREFRLACTAAPVRVHITVDYERGADAEAQYFEAFSTLEILDAEFDANGAPIGPH